MVCSPLEKLLDNVPLGVLGTFYVREIKHQNGIELKPETYP